MCICVCKRAVSALINCGEITWFSKREVCHQKPLHRSISRFSTVSRLIWRGAVSLKTDRRVKLVMRDAGLGKKRHLQLAREWSVNKYVLPTQATLYQLSLKTDRQWLVHLKPQAGILMGVLSVDPPDKWCAVFFITQWWAEPRTPSFWVMWMKGDKTSFLPGQDLNSVAIHIHLRTWTSQITIPDVPNQNLTTSHCRRDASVQLKLVVL